MTANFPVPNAKYAFTSALPDTLTLCGITAESVLVEVELSGEVVFSATLYAFNQHKLSMTTMSLSRDLHCFEMSASVVLKPYTSFNFTFRATASELADALKWDKRSSYSTNVEWY